MARTGDFALVVHPGLGAGTLAEFVALLRREPGRHRYATTAPGGVVHVITETFKLRTGTAMGGCTSAAAASRRPRCCRGACR